MHPFEAIMVRVTQVIDYMRDRGYRSFQASGYCYGGRVSLLLAQTRIVRSSVAAHPSDLTKFDPELVIQPVFLVVPQFDERTFLDQVPAWNATLLRRHMDYKIKVYPNATHGFGTTGDGNNTVNGREKLIAIQDSVAWFKAYQ